MNVSQKNIGLDQLREGLGEAALIKQAAELHAPSLEKLHYIGIPKLYMSCLLGGTESGRIYHDGVELAQQLGVHLECT